MRDWLRVKGPDALRFLQGMWTCDFKRAAKAAQESGHATVGEGLLLNTKGRPLSSGIFLCEAPDNFLISLPLGHLEKVREALDRLLVADEVELISEEKPSFDARVWTLPVGEGLTRLSEIPVDVPVAKDRIFFSERQPWGLCVPRGTLSVSHVEYWIHPGAAPEFSFEELSSEAFTKIRIDAGVPEFGVDYNEESLVLEFPFAQAISFFKGCYVGQEVVARGTYRGKMNRGFARFHAEAPLSLDFVLAEVDGEEKPVGKITSVAGASGLGLVRVAALAEAGPSGLFQKNSRGTRLPMKAIEILT